MPNYFKTDDKHVVIVLTKEEYNSIPKRLEKPENTEVSRPILPNGEINWECKCLGSLPVGPCGVQFRESYTCLRNSKSDPPGEDCVESFLVLKECMSKYPSLYENQFADDDNDDDNNDNNNNSTPLPPNNNNKTEQSSSSTPEQK